MTPEERADGLITDFIGPIVQTRGACSIVEKMKESIVVNIKQCVEEALNSQAFESEVAISQAVAAEREACAEFLEDDHDDLAALIRARK